MATHWPKMKDVWPGLDYENMNVVLFYLGADGEVDEALLLNTQEKRTLHEEEHQEIFPPGPGGYAQDVFEGKKAIILSVDAETMSQKDAVSETYRIATHEPVHFFYQEEAQITMDEDRTQVFPIDKNHRVVRGMLYRHLVLAYENKDLEEEHLAKAKYWLDKWREDYTKEYREIKHTDIVESTARYIENMGTFIGTATTQEQMDEGADKNIQRNHLFLSSDEESYEIGYVAALLLDRRVPDWKNSFYATGSTVEEVLLENIVAMPNEVHPEWEAEVTKAIEDYNAEIAKTIADLVKLKDDLSVPLLKLEVSQSTSSMHATDMIRYDGRHVSLNYQNRFKVNDKVIHVNTVNVFEEFDERGDQYVYVPLLMDYEINNDVLTVKEESLTVEGIQVETLQEDGRTVYFVKVTE